VTEPLAGAWALARTAATMDDLDDVDADFDEAQDQGAAGMADPAGLGVPAGSYYAILNVSRDVRLCDHADDWWAGLPCSRGSCSAAAAFRCAARFPTRTSRSRTAGCA